MVTRTLLSLFLGGAFSKKWGQSGDKMPKSRSHKINQVCKVVPGAGIEPAHPQGVRDFKSLASTYSATQARKTVKPSNTSEKSVTSENREPQACMAQCCHFLLTTQLAIVYTG
jgi:hypothetical protein